MTDDNLIPPVQKPLPRTAFEKDTIRRLSSLEEHLINLIYPIQQINTLFTQSSHLQRLMDALRTPLKVDDKEMKDICSHMDKTIKTFREEIKDYDMIKTLAEIKFIGKRVHEMEEMLKSMCSEGVTHKMSLQMTMDGYEMVKKTVNHQKEDEVVPAIDPYELDKQIISFVNVKYRNIFIHRAGLLGNPPQTFNSIGMIEGISAARVSQKFSMACWARREDKVFLKLVRKLNNPVLNKSRLFD